MLIQGQPTASILFINDRQRIHCKAEEVGIAEYLLAPLLGALRKAGLDSSTYAFITQNESSDEEFRVAIMNHQANILVPLGEQMLRLITGERGIDKWQLSIIPATAEYGGRKCMPLYSPEHVQKIYSDHAFYSVAAHKLAQQRQIPTITTPQRKFVLAQDFKTAAEYLIKKVIPAKVIALDWEFSRGLINTVGFAISATEAIAVRTSVDIYTVEEHFNLWKLIAKVCEGPAKKIVQHCMVESTWMARYGIQLENVYHDTMWCAKFLNPEFDKGLDNVGRLYTPYPYWKDDNDSWSNIRNWSRHLDYNCKDTTGTFAAYQAQTRELKDRGLTELFYGFIMQFEGPVREMCVTGLNVDPEMLLNVRNKLNRQQENYLRIIDDECIKAIGKTINVRSHKQLHTVLKAMGMKLPTKKNKKTNESNDTTDRKALAKLRRQNPDASIIPALIGISATNKQLSSYTEFSYDTHTSRVHYNLDACGTETGRFAGFLSAWGTGFNPQTVPSSAKGIFVADPGTVLLEIDLEKAESWYVALDSPEPRLIEMLESGGDIHSYVAAGILNKPQDFITKQERQLGKKVGHASNYGTGPRTFAEQVLSDMGQYLTEQEAKKMLEGYFEVFPNIRKRQARIRGEIYQHRYLKTPIGRERYFFGRTNDATYREAYAYQPQSTIPDITNHLMLALWRDRDALGLGWEEGGRFLLQVHDSLLLQCDPGRASEIARFAKSLDWHPKITLAGGELRIPVSVKMGKRWKGMENV